MGKEPDDRIAERMLDAIGLACPLPVLMARKALSRMRAGEVLLVEASDPMAAIDIPHLCREDGHVLLSQRRSADGEDVRLSFRIERGVDRER